MKIPADCQTAQLKAVSFGRILPSQLLMERETRAAYGTVPRSLNSDHLPQGHWQLVGEEFLLRGEGDQYFYYRRGDGITIDRGAGIETGSEALWLDGSVYAAVASINGLLPIHASAVVHNDRVFAFTGPAGAGKSTLVAALGRRGLPMFCDDTLILDLSDPDRITCLPGHKRLKLHKDALELTGVTPEERVSPIYEKYFARPLGLWRGGALLLGEIVCLADGDEMAIQALSGSERFAQLADDHQTAHLFERALRFDRQALFDHRTHLARRIQMASFVRPHSRDEFAKGVDFVADHIEHWTGP